MNSFLASIFAALFSFCHASSVRQASNKPVAFEQEQPGVIEQYVPSRREIARMQAEPGYAEGACISCQRMNVAYNVR